MTAIHGVVDGKVLFPEHPEHEGGWGLVGGEDAVASRTTFVSPGQAMTWCEKVLDGQVKPRNVEYSGDLLDPYVGPAWEGARVRYVAGGDEPDIEWHLYSDGWWEVKDLGYSFEQVQKVRER